MKKINPKYIALIIVIILLCFLSWCHGRSGVKTETGKPDKPNHDSIYKSEQKDNEIIKEAIRKDSVLTITKIKYIVHYKTVYDSLYITDTLCQQSLITLYNAFGDLNNANDSIIANKDTIIKTLVHKIETKQNHITIDSTYIQYLVNDSIPKAFKRGKRVGRKQGFVGGLILSGAVIVGIKAIP